MYADLNHTTDPTDGSTLAAQSTASAYARTPSTLSEAWSPEHNVVGRDADLSPLRGPLLLGRVLPGSIGPRTFRTRSSAPLPAARPIHPQFTIKLSRCTRLYAV